MERKTLPKIFAFARCHSVCYFIPNEVISFILFFSFHSTPLLEAIGDIGRWYNVDVEITDNSLKESTISLSMPRNVSLEDFVNSINLTKNLSAVLENGKILICPKNASKSTKLFSLYDALAEKQDVPQ